MQHKFIVAHMSAAEVYSQLSSARRLKVGCVIVKNDTIIGIGYNGMPSGWTNECEYDYVNDIGELILKTKPEALHAESNALAKVARSTNSSDGAMLFVTHAPCLDCAKLIYQAGIIEVYYHHPYRDSAGIDFLKKCNVKVVSE
jgi:dCMP deaminase